MSPSAMLEVRALSPIGSLGYGVNAESLKRAMAEEPSFIGSDSGSTDCGAFYLGAGKPYQSRKAMKRDLRLVLAAARQARIPLIIGSAGLAGAKPHLQWMLDILKEVASEDGHRFKLAVITSDQRSEYLRAAMRQGRVRSFPGVPPLTDATIDRIEALVAQMGTAPYIEALDNGAEVILAGRSCDTAIFASYCIWRGFDRGLALHMSKIIECGALSAIPPTGRDAVLGVLRRDHFLVRCPNPERSVTPGSVAGHMVYEVEHPFLQEEPEGTQDFSDVSMQEEGAATRVAGSRFVPRAVPTLRFEGAELRGYRSALVGGIRDPFLIERIADLITACEQQVRDLEADQCDFEFSWQVYGQDGVMGDMEPTPAPSNHEVGVLAQVLAPTQERAHDVASLLEARMIGYSYPGAKTRTANIAFPISPMVMDTGAVYRFGVLHVVELASASELRSLFPIHYEPV